VVRNSGLGVFLALCENRGGEQPLDAATVGREVLTRFVSRDIQSANPKEELQVRPDHTQAARCAELATGPRTVDPPALDQARSRIDITTALVVNSYNNKKGRKDKRRESEVT